MKPEQASDEAKETTVFVVLCHDDREGRHYDLMIDRGEYLATWKSSLSPETAQALAVAFQRIGDHRRMYLDYEGPVSGDRGTVRRHDCGTCEVQVKAVDHWLVRYRGEKLNGEYELVRKTDGAWLLRPRPTGTPGL